MAASRKKNDEKHKTHLRVGVITRPHGIRGELKVRLHFEASSALHDASHVVVEPTKGEAKSCEIESLRGNPQKELILALFDVTTREAAEALKGAQLWVSRASQPPLEPGEYYLVDLVGCEVFLEGIRIANVTDVRPDPSVDTMILSFPDGSTGEVPIVDAWVGKVDIENSRVELLTEDGIIR